MFGGKYRRIFVNLVVFGGKSSHIMGIYWCVSGLFGAKLDGFVKTAVVYGSKTDVFGRNTVVFWANTVIFGETTVLFGKNTVLFGTKKSVLWALFLLSDTVIFWGIQQNWWQIIFWINKVLLRNVLIHLGQISCI